MGWASPGIGTREMCPGHPRAQGATAPTRVCPIQIPVLRALSERLPSSDPPLPVPSKKLAWVRGSLQLEVGRAPEMEGGRTRLVAMQLL